MSIQYRSPYLERAQRLNDIRNLPATLAATLNSPAGHWHYDPHIYLLNNDLRVGPPQHSLESLCSRTLELLRLAFASERQPHLGRDWHQPLVKLILPILLGLVTPKDFWVAPEGLAGTAKDEFYYFGPTVLYYVAHFEKFRATIEGMWGGTVIIEEMPGRPGGVRIRPAPKIPPEVPLTDISPNQVVLGTDLFTGAVSGVSVTALTHMLVVGTAGFGKSVFLHQLIAQLLAAEHDQVEEVVLVDLKGGVEFIAYAEQSNRVRAVWRYAEVVQTIDYLIGLMEARQEEMLARRWRMFQGRRVFLIIDEFAQIQLYPIEGREEKATHERLIANLNRLSMLGRAMGIVIVAAIQKATTDVMDSSFRMNLQGQVCFRVPNRLMASTMFGSVEELRLDPVALPRGQFIYYDPTSGTTRYLQAHMVPS